MPRMRSAEHEVPGWSALRRAGRNLAALLVILLSLATAGCGGEESALIDDLAGPGDLRAGAELEGTNAPPWLDGGDPATHMAKALDAAGIAGVERTKVNELVADFRKENADTIAKLTRAAARAKAEADQGNPPDRARWREIVATEGLEPGALRDEMRTLRHSISDVLTPDQRQKLRAAWRNDRGGRGHGGGRFGRFGEGVIRDLALTPDQESKIQGLLADFGSKHQGEIKALRGVFGEGGPRGAGRGRGPGREDCPDPGTGPRPQAGRGPQAGLGLGPHLHGEFKEALTAAGYDPEAFKKDLAALHDQALTLLSAEQQEKLRGHGLHLFRRLLAPESPAKPASPESPAKP